MVSLSRFLPVCVVSLIFSFILSVFYTVTNEARAVNGNIKINTRKENKYEAETKSHTKMFSNRNTTQQIIGVLPQFKQSAHILVDT